MAGAPPAPPALLPRLVAAALAYAALLLLAGFLLGTIRTLVIAPRTGAFLAVAMELPLMLVWAAFTGRRIIARLPINGPAEALGMGGLAFCLLMAAECALAFLLVGQTPSAWLATLAQPAGALGLAGQIAAGIIPAIIARRGSAQ